MSAIYGNMQNNIDNVASTGLSGTVDSLGYTVDVIETHLHNINKCLGYNASAPEAGALNAVTAFTLTGGNAAWGTEIQVHNGSIIEAGSATKKFDIAQVNIPTIGTANVNTLVEVNYGTRDAGQIGFFLNTGDFIGKRSVAMSASTQDAGDTITPTIAGNVPGLNARIVLDTIVTSTGISNDIIYYAVGITATTFQVSLTSSGAAVAITTNGTCNFSVETAHGLANGTKIMLSGAGIPAQWNVQTVYYVTNSTTDTFTVALTLGGSTVTVASAGQVTYHVLTQALLTDFYVCSATNTPQQLVISTPCLRIPCNSRLWIRGWSNGATNALGVLFNYHVYSA